MPNSWSRLDSTFPFQSSSSGNQSGSKTDSFKMQPTPGAGTRYHSLDAVRAFALLLGVVFHAAESFGHRAIYYWAIGDNSPSVTLELFRYACHSFRLELFFLIAGFFAHLLWQRRGVWGFVRNRAGRILVPFVIGWLVLYPLLVFIWVTGASKSGHWDIAGVPPEFRSLPPWQLTVGFFLHLQFLRKFDLTHLWFLYQLLVLYGVALLARRIVLHLGRSGSTVVRWIDGGVRAALTSPWKLLWFTAVALPVLYLQHYWTVDTPKESLIPELPATLLFALFFGVGWALHRQPDLLEACGRHWPGHLLIGLILVAPSGGLDWFFHAPEPSQPHYVWIRLGHFAVYSLMMWSFVFGFLGLFLHYRRRESPAWRYIADSSYWVYLAHLPLVVSLQVWVAFWPVSWVLKFLVINLAAFPLLFLSYHYLVRSTFIGQQLNGRRYPFKPIPGRAARREPDGHSGFNLNSEVKKQNQSQKA
jgi:glucans biosynthesis protein C